MKSEQGKISDLSQLHNGWFIGAFVDNQNFNTESAQNFECKWSVRAKGESHTSDKPVNPNDNSSTLIILIRGSLEQTMDGQKYVLENEGDYLFYSPNQPHTVEFKENSILLTIRWYN